MSEYNNILYNLIKRIFDIVASSAILIVLSPILFLISFLVKFSSDGPILYRGCRVGRYGDKFMMYKFRTMKIDSEKFGTTTSLRDPRVTKFGNLLRRYKLDELPQLFNVLAGEMSIVGPRPEVVEHTEVYTEEEREILSVLPGITDYSSVQLIGLTELLGSDNAHDVFITQYRSKKNALRLRYVQERSFLTDFKIILLTIRALISKLFNNRI